MATGSPAVALLGQMHMTGGNGQNSQTESQQEPRRLEFHCSLLVRQLLLPMLNGLDCRLAGTWDKLRPGPNKSPGYGGLGWPWPALLQKPPSQVRARISQKSRQAGLRPFLLTEPAELGLRPRWARMTLVNPSKCFSRAHKRQGNRSGTWDISKIPCGRSAVKRDELGEGKAELTPDVGIEVIA